MKFEKKSKLTLILSAVLSMLIVCTGVVTVVYAATNNQYFEKFFEETIILNEADKRGIEIMQKSGTWGETMEEVLPYMTNAGIDITVKIYNQKHPGQEKVASYYYNTNNHSTFNFKQDYSQNNLQKTKKHFNDSSVETITLNITDCPNVKLNMSNDETFMYECYEQLYDTSLVTNNNELILTLKQKPDSEHLVTGSVENFVNVFIPDYQYRKIKIDGNNSGITLYELNTNLEINNLDTALFVYIPQHFNKNISCTSVNGSVTTYFNSLASNYTLNLEKDNDTYVSLYNRFTNYQHNNSTYTFVEGNGTAAVNINLKLGFFVASFYDSQIEKANMQAGESTKNQQISNMWPSAIKNLNPVDKAAVELMEYTGNWEIVELLIPNMSEYGINRLAEIYNQKNQYTNMSAKKPSDYYNVTGAEADVRALTMMKNNGMWKYVEPLFPYMSREGIDKVVDVYNEKHMDKKIAEDYYKVDSTTSGNVVINLNNNNTFNIAESGSFKAKNDQILTLDIVSTIKGGTVDLFLFDPSFKEQRITIGSGNISKEIKLTEGIWQYNCSGIFKDGGSIEIIGTIKDQNC